MNMDPLLVQLIADAEPVDRPVLANAAGEADVIGRHLPIHAMPAAVRAAWLVDRAWRADQAESPYATALWRVALAAVTDAAQHMEPLVLRAPADPSDLL